MSKVSDAKEAQGFKTKPNMCKNCAHFEKKVNKLRTGWVDYIQIRCTLGGFAVKPTNTCDKFEVKF